MSFDLDLSGSRALVTGGTGDADDVIAYLVTLK
jgi:hypothetical protein